MLPLLLSWVEGGRGAYDRSFPEVDVAAYVNRQAPLEGMLCWPAAFGPLSIM